MQAYSDRGGRRRKPGREHSFGHSFENELVTNRDDFGVYVHWPFCASKCPYCDFNSHVRESVDMGAWTKAYLREIAHYAEMTRDRTVTSVFFGGGTPSLMDPAVTAAVIRAIDDAWGLSPDCEITLEANPNSVEARKFEAFRSAGINRVSIGVQSLDDASLKFLGRRHDAKEAVQAIEIASKTFDRFSFDLMYARPNQSLEDWRQELDMALKMAGDHLSLYQLTIEKGTAFHTAHARGDFTMPDDDTGGAFYEETQERLNRAGLPAYEISNHARAGEESRHNLVYWHYGDYAGIGPGAHGRLSLPDAEGAAREQGGRRVATRAHRAPEIWLQRVAEKGHGAHDFEPLSADAIFDEALMMGLRLKDGVSLDRLESLSGLAFEDRIGAARLSGMTGGGFLTLDGEERRLKPTLAGMQRLNAVLRYLLG